MQLGNDMCYGKSYKYSLHMFLNIHKNMKKITYVKW